MPPTGTSPQRSLPQSECPRTLDDAKTLLRRLQEAIVQDQVGEALMLAGNAMTVANNARSMMIEGVFSTLFSGEFG